MQIPSNSLFQIKAKAGVFALFLLFAFHLALPAQERPGGRPGGGQQMNIGRFYGKVVDDNGKGVGYATVQLFGMRFDTASRSMKETMLAGQITEDNGDFSLENLPVTGEFTLKTSFLGYADAEQKVSFGLPAGAPGGGRPGGQAPGQTPGQTPGRADGNGAAALAAKFDKDLGNIRLSESSVVLDQVTVEAEALGVGLALDRKVYKVDKNSVAAGGTAEDALKNVPSLAVDLDGGVTLRNAAPQLFVDGRPTTLSLEQIPADAIESVEVITNPSAKYDASGGQAGIVNIVLKKERRIGYNGSVRIGADSRGAFNGGGDLNARDRKINAFVSANLNQRRSRGTSETDRENFFGMPRTSILQQSETKNQGFFANGRAGFDWFMSNRNTLTLSGNYTRGQFKPEDVIGIHTDSIFPGETTFSDARRLSNTQRDFRNLGASILFKHLFPKEGAEWTADANFNKSVSWGEGGFNTTYTPSGDQSRERQSSDGGNEFITLQTDFVNPVSDNIKFEGGVRAAIRYFRTDQFNERYDFDDQAWERVESFTDRYKFDDQVVAAYGTFSHQFPKWGYQLGLRAESSRYTGTLQETGQRFENDFPLSLFPSVFLTRKLNEEDNVQLSYARRINRPNFFQLMPFTDYSDSLNLRRGNPDLLPEFTNSLELTYQNVFVKGHNLLVSAYFKKAEDLITSYADTIFDASLNRQVVLSTFANASGSQAYGVEFTLRNTFFKIVELTSNLNFYNSKVDATNIEPGLENERFTWFAKENLSVKLPEGFTLQLTGEYQSRAAFSPSGGGERRGGGGGGGGGWHGGPSSTAQGYSLANWFVDAALRKDLMKRKATLTVNIQDIFRTRKNGSHTENLAFVQDTWRRRDPQVVRVNFSYRFGKMDASLFRRKNTRVSTEGMEMMQQ